MRSRREKVVKKRRQPRLVKVREDAKRGAVVRNRGNVDHLMPETLESSKTMTVHVWIAYVVEFSLGSGQEDFNKVWGEK